MWRLTAADTDNNYENVTQCDDLRLLTLTTIMRTWHSVTTYDCWHWQQLWERNTVWRLTAADTDNNDENVTQCDDLRLLSADTGNNDENVTHSVTTYGCWHWQQWWERNTQCDDLRLLILVEDTHLSCCLLSLQLTYLFLYQRLCTITPYHNMSFKPLVSRRVLQGSGNCKIPQDYCRKTVGTTVCLKKTSPTFLAVTRESIVGFT